MIIWSRWGILSFVAFGLGVGMAFATFSLLNLETEGFGMGAMVFFWAAVFNAALAYLVYPRLDKPRPVTFTRPLPQPYTWPDGRIQTHEVVPALDPEGRPIQTAPRSTLFFVPARVLWIPLAAVSAVLTVIALVAG